MLSKLFHIDLIPVKLLALSHSLFLQQVFFHFWTQELVSIIFGCRLRPLTTEQSITVATWRKLRFRWGSIEIRDHAIVSQWCSLRSDSFLLFLIGVLSEHWFAFVHIIPVNKLNCISSCLVELPKWWSFLVGYLFLFNLSLACIHEVIKSVLNKQRESCSTSQSSWTINEYLLVL